MTSASEFLSKRGGQSQSAADFLSKRSGSRQTVATAQPAETQGNAGRGRAQQLLQGASFGFGDEITAGVVGLLSRLNPDERRSIMEVYREELDAERDEMARNAEELGTLEKIGLQGAGGLLTGGALLKGAQAADKAVKLGRGGMALKGAAATAPALANPVSGGAIEGGIAGFGGSEADTLAGKAIDTAKGAALGAGTAGAVTTVGRGFGTQFAEDIADTARAVGKSIGQRADDLGFRISPAVRTGNAAGAATEEALQSNSMTKSLFNKDVTHNKDVASKLILRRFGVKGRELDGETLELIGNRINKEYDAIGDAVSDAVQFGPIDAEQVTEINGILEEVAGFMDDVDNPNRLKGLINDVGTALQGSRSAKGLMQLVNKLRKTSVRAYRNAQPNDGDAISQLEDLITKQAMDLDPKIAVRLKEARRAWRDYKAIDVGTVTNTASGRLNPVSLANRLNRGKFTRRVFGDIDDQSEVLEIGRFIAQVEDTGADPNFLFGLRSGSDTAKKQSLRNAATSLAGAVPYTVGRALGPTATTATAEALRRVTPRLAALQAATKEDR